MSAVEEVWLDEIRSASVRVGGALVVESTA
jgi:hypothetical protein